MAKSPAADRNAAQEAFVEAENEGVTVGGDNIFADLGFSNPEEELAKAKLVSAIADVIRDKKLSQARVAGLIGIDQPAVSKLLRGRTGGYSTDRLIHILNQLGQDVSINISPKRAEVARVSVAVFHEV